MNKNRIRIFIDFWNFQISWNEYHRNKHTENNEESAKIYKIPWQDTLPEVLLQRIEPSGVYVGTHVYTSINPNSKSDKGLNRFLHAMDGFPGYTVIKKERRPASPVKCTEDDCRKEIFACPHCGKELKRTVEKGIDASIITDLIKSVLNDTFDKAILITEDSDFVPVVELIQERWTKQIVHVFFRGKSDELRNACWRHLFIEDMMNDLLSGESTQD